MNLAEVGLNPHQLAAFCQKHHIRSLAFFGSVVREDFRGHSDIDVLVEFEPAHIPGFDFFNRSGVISAAGPQGRFANSELLEHRDSRVCFVGSHHCV